jgi:tetratricopeptide (TPR) repeat protein
VEASNGEVWGALGHCFLMMEDLQQAYTAYQQALIFSPNPKDPNLWYGIGILYDRYGSYDLAEEAFNAVLRMDNLFEKKAEIQFRLGVIYKQQAKFDKSLECFRAILTTPPPPLTSGDVFFQMGHVMELKKEFAQAKESYEYVLKENASHAKVLQQLGWLYHHHTDQELGLGNQEVAISYLMRSIGSDPADAQTWYLLGRCYMTQQKHRKAFDAYQQAVYRDSNNPTFWCSIGVLYFHINQYRDALDAYSRAIRLNPYLSEVWVDLGTLYEACSQRSDAIYAYQRAAELDPASQNIQQRLAALNSSNTDASGNSTPAGTVTTSNNSAASNNDEVTVGNISGSVASTAPSPPAGGSGSGDKGANITATTPNTVVDSTFAPMEPLSLQQPSSQSLVPPTAVGSNLSPNSNNNHMEVDRHDTGDAPKTSEPSTRVLKPPAQLPSMDSQQQQQLLSGSSPLLPLPLASTVPPRALSPHLFPGSTDGNETLIAPIPPLVAADTSAPSAAANHATTVDPDSPPPSPGPKEKRKRPSSPSLIPTPSLSQPQSDAAAAPPTMTPTQGTTEQQIASVGSGVDGNNAREAGDNDDNDREHVDEEDCDAVLAESLAKRPKHS